MVTSAIKEHLISIGFKLEIIGTKEEHEINSRELKTNFNGHDIAIGLAATPTSYGTRRKYSALVIDFPKE